MLTDDEVREEILEEIADIQNEIEEKVAEVFDRKRDLEFHRKALNCDHNWVDGTPFSIQGIAFIYTECTKCGYQTDMRKYP